MNKVALFAFNGEPTCFVHVLLNAIDMKTKGYDVRVILEGSTPGLVPEISREGHPLRPLYQKARELGVIEGACRACSMKMNAVQSVKEQGLDLLDDMSGHPGMSRYREMGYEIITF